MKKIILIGLFIVTGAVIASCGITADTSLVTITVGEGQTATLESERATLYAKLKNYLRRYETPEALAAIPSNIVTIRLTVSGPGMATIVKTATLAGESSVRFVVEIPNGPSRTFLVECFDNLATLVYSGSDTVDLRGVPVKIAVDMIDLFALYVDSVFGSDVNNCGNIGFPDCKTITYGLSQAVINQTIYVRAGTYSNASGETFPLQLLDGTALRCRGINHSTIIDAQGAAAPTQPAITGPATGAASVEGCRIINSSPAVDDNGSSMYVANNMIDGQQSNCAQALVISGNTVVENNTISGFTDLLGGCDCLTAISILSGNVMINNNSITNNEVAIDTLFAANTTISGNLVTNNVCDGIVLSGPATISNNTINNNGDGITINAGTQTITGNTIRDNNIGVSITFGDITMNSNTLSCNVFNDLLNWMTAGPLINAQNNMWDHATPTQGCTNSGE
ncbi:MAG: DUF1565 domain-containing protein, partial [Nitrospirota bacterium]